jgi:1,4-dihydroxy-2-naphthoate octaprenyltransferase
VVLGRIKTAVQVIRAPFIAATVVPALVGSFVAWPEGLLHVGYLALTLLGVACVNAALNLSNDYFDHLSGADERNQGLTPFSGGSRAIQDGVASPRQVLAGSVAFYLVSIAIGLVLVWLRGWTLLWFGIAGLFVALFHNGPPIKLYYLAPGLGEFATAVGCGPLIVLGSYYVQTQRLSWGALWASIPVGLLAAAVLYINEFPDYRADRAVGKKTLVVVLGRERAVWGYVALLAAAYLVLVLGVVIRALPYTVLLALLPLPMAVQAIRGVRRFHSDVESLIPTNARTIQLDLLAGLLVCVGYILARFL